MTDAADERANVTPSVSDDETVETVGTGHRPESAATPNVSADVAPELFEP